MTEIDSESGSAEKVLRSRKCVCLLLLAVVLATILFILFATNVIPVRRSECEKSSITITESTFGQTKSGKQVIKYTMKNSHGVELGVISHGATVVSLKIPDKNGNIDDVVLGYDNMTGYEENNPYFGSSVGRYANRIDNGRFVLDGETYQVTQNDGENSLHGGTDNWSTRLWEAESFPEEGYIQFKITSLDRDQGFPGKVEAYVTYELTEENSVIINFTANVRKKATPINLTNHAYFNLKGHNKGTIYDHDVRIFAPNYLPVTDDLIPIGDITSVSGTIFDLRNGVRLGDVLNNVPGGGYDHNFCLSGPTGKHLAARVSHPDSGRTLEVYTNQPGVQFYTGNFLDEKTAKDGAVYKKHNGFCLETQNYPNAPNEEAFPDSILRPGSTYMHQCWYSFKW